MKSQKLQNTVFGIIIGIAVLAILAVVLDNIKYTPTKVYTDKQYGFSLKYPAYWSLEERPANGAGLVIFFAPKMSEKDRFVENVSISLFPLARTPKLRNLDAFTRETTRQLLGVFGKYVKVMESAQIRLGGQPAFRFSYATLGKTLVTGGKFKCLYVWTIRGPYAFIITFVGDSKDFNENLKHVNRMIKTFKFRKK